jgi:hypothetical protein
MARSRPDVLVASTAKTVTVTDTWPHGITIAKLPNADGSVAVQPIWYRLDGVDPVPMGDDSFIVLDVLFLPNPADGEGYTPQREGVEVRLICAEATRFTVEGNPTWKAPA